MRGSISLVAVCIVLLMPVQGWSTGGGMPPGVEHAGTGGDPADAPQATWDYVMDTNATFNWYDARSGLNLTKSLRNAQGAQDRDDGFTSAVFSNFTFNFYGVDYTRIYVSANGYTGFDPASDYTVSVPAITFPTSDPKVQKILAMYWDDLDFTSRGAIYFKEFPDASNPQAVVVEYFRTVHFGNQDEAWFELVLRRDGTLLFQFRYVKYVQGGIITGLNDGDGKHYNIYNGMNNTTTDLAIAFYRPSTLTLTGADISPAQVDQGEQDIHMLRLTARSDRGVITILGMRIDRTGTLPDSSIDRVRLYHDIDRSGNLTAGDTLLGDKTFVSGSLTFPLSLRVNASGEVMLVLLDLNASAKAGRGFGLLMKDRTYVMTQQMVSEATFPIQTRLVTVLDALPDTLYVSGMNQAPLTVEAGRVNVVMLALFLDSSSDYIRLSSLNVSRTGNATDADVPAAVLIYDKDRSGDYSGGDVPLAYSPFASGRARFNNLTFLVEEPTRETLLVACNISAGASLGRSVGTMLPAQGGMDVLPPDSVAAHPAIYSYNSTIVGDTTPPDVQAVQIDPPPPVSAGRVNFTVTFTEAMDISAPPEVSFGTQPPYTSHDVPGSWVNQADWRGSYTVTSGTGDGVNTIRVGGARDLRGNTMTVNTDHTFVIDTAIPRSNVTPMPNETYTAVFPVSYTASDTGTGISSVELFYRWGGGAWRSYGNFTSSPVQFSSPGDGQYEFYTVARDRAGNVEPPPTTPDAGTLVDSLPPETRVQGLQPYYNVSSMDLPFAAFDNGTGIDHVELFYRVSGGVWNLYPEVTASSPFRLNVSIDGSYEFYTVGVDRAGHREPPPPTPDASTIIDTTPPQVDVIHPNGNEVLPGGSTVSVSWEARDNLGVTPPAKVMFSWDGGLTWTTLGTSSTDIFTWAVNDTIDSQECLIRVEVRDLAGNTGQDSSDTFFTVASTRPASMVHPLPGYTNVSTFQVGYTVLDPRGVGISEVRLYARQDGGAWYEAARDPDATGEFTFTSKGDGRYEFYSVAVGANGEAEPAPRSPDAVTIVDTTPPRVVGTYPSGEFTGERANVTVMFSERMLTGSVVLETVPEMDGMVTWTANNTTMLWYPSNDTPAKMEFTVKAGAMDLAGNRMRADHTWRIGPPGPPDATPLLALILGLALVTLILGYMLVRRRTRRCTRCGRRVPSGRYCARCIPGRSDEEGVMRDGVFVVEPVPPSPEEDRAALPPEEDGPETAPRREAGSEPHAPGRGAEGGRVAMGSLKKGPPPSPDRPTSARERLRRIRERRQKRGGPG